DEALFPSHLPSYTRRLAVHYLLTPYADTSFAWKSRVGGSVRARALVALRLLISSNFMSCSPGSSAALAPFRSLSTPQDSAVRVVECRPAGERAVLFVADLFALIIHDPEHNVAVRVPPQDVIVGAVQRCPAGERAVLFVVHLIALCVHPPERYARFGREVDRDRQGAHDPHIVMPSFIARGKGEDVLPDRKRAQGEAKTMLIPFIITLLKIALSEVSDLPGGIIHFSKGRLLQIILRPGTEP